MKHAFTSLLFALPLFAGAQTHLPLKDFQDQSLTSGGWSTFIEEGTFDWEVDDQGTPGNYYAIMSNYNGSSNDTAVVWMISPAMDLSSAVTPTLTFKNACNYSGPNLTLRVSFNYDGVSAPGTATWTDITGSANWSAGSWNFVSSGNVDLSAYNGEIAVYIAFVYDGGPVADGKDWEVDEILVNEGGSAGPVPHTIYELQYTTLGSGDSPFKDSLISTAGIVTSLEDDGYFLQDGAGAWNGIYVYDGTNTVARGDSVEIAGTIDEYFGYTQIENIVSFNLVSSGNTLPAAEVVTTGGFSSEQYEAVLLQVQNAACTSTGSNAIWNVNDGSGSGMIQTGSSSGLFAYTPTVGNIYWITGILNYSFSEYKIWPRDAADILNITGVDQTLSDLDIRFGYNKLIVNIDGLCAVSVYDAAGKLLMSEKIRGNGTVDFSGLSNGMYTAYFQAGSSVRTEKIIKR